MGLGPDAKAETGSGAAGAAGAAAAQGEDAAGGYFQAGAAHHIANQARGHDELALPPVLATVAETGQGIKELVDAIKAHEAGLAATGLLAKRRVENLAWELGKAAADRILSGLEADERRGYLRAQAEAVLGKKTDFYDALDAIAQSLRAGS
jgi:LAO/AO transport system kinase